MRGSAILVLLLTCNVAAIEIHVPVDYGTIQAAIVAASDGDSIVVSDGVYLENLNLLGKAVSLSSVNGLTATTIEGGSSGPTIICNSGEGLNSIVEGFTITGGLQVISAEPGGGLWCFNSSPTIRNNLFVENEAGDGGGAYLHGSNAEIVGNEFLANIASRGGGIYCNTGAPLIANNTFCLNVAEHGGAIRHDSPVEAVITRNTFYGNTADNNGGALDLQGLPVVTHNEFVGNSAFRGGAVRAFSGSGMLIASNIFHDNTAEVGGAIEVVTDVLLFNNTIYANSAVDGGGIHLSSECTIRNCILWGNTAVNGSQISITSHQPIIDHCNIETPIAGTGNLSEPPLFVSPTTGDFHLQPDSPCINTGSPFDVSPLWDGEDWDGENRVSCVMIDMGADEYPACPGAVLVRGDCDGSGTIDVGDPLHLLGVLFQDLDPQCFAACDANDSGVVDIADPIGLLLFIFSTAPAPPPPFPACGSIPPGGSLHCLTPTCP